MMQQNQQQQQPPQGQDNGQQNPAQQGQPGKSRAPMDKTKVLYVQNLPDEFRADLEKICQNFGPVREMMPLPEKRSCFVEFQDITHAVACHDFYNKETIVLGSRPIKFSYSSRGEITLKPNADNNPPGNILLITVNNVQYPVTVDVLYQVFCRVGTLEKVIIFERGSYIQAFVQMEDVRQAMKAKEQFDSQCVYNGCNSLRIQYSGLQSISVKSNSERSWDFTAGSTARNQPPKPGHANGGYSGYGTHGGNQMDSSKGQCVCIVHNIHEELTQPQHLAALFAVYANVQRVKIMFHKRSTALVLLERPEMCRNAINGLQGVVLHGQELKVEQSKGSGVPPAKAGEDFTKEFMTMPEYNRYRNQPLKSFTRSDCLHFGNMPDGVSEQDIRNFLQSANLPSPMKIKFLNDQHHMAAVKFPTQNEAVDALASAHGCDFGGRTLRVGFGHMKD